MPVEIKYIAHSGFCIGGSNGYVLIDPMISGIEDVDTTVLNEDIRDILLTHAHGDHLGDSISIARSNNIKITAIFELANYCSRKNAQANGVNIGGKITFEWGNAMWLTAAHTSSTPDGMYAGVAASILLEMDGLTIYHAGDTGLHADLEMIGTLYKPEVSILPIGGNYTMGVDEAVQAAKWLGSKKIIPMHYNTFPVIKADPHDFKRKIDAFSECIIMKPGDSYKIYSTD
jgi:L-ascorbate metabolism protein UlaG (beta-lactamase superfamily)